LISSANNCSPRLPYRHKSRYRYFFAFIDVGAGKISKKYFGDFGGIKHDIW
jgi:hypothetical protein